ncbi:MAG TPA: hypothetical protein VIJ12_08820 [Candidatus Baltobacteraceae bacterium]
MGQYHNLEAVADAVREAGGLKTFWMHEVRDAYGAERLGRQVRNNISDELDGLGMRHQPSRELPDSQNAMVRIYRAGSPAAKLIEAAQERNIGDDEDALLREAANANSEAAYVLGKIREALGD